MSTKYDSESKLSKDLNLAFNKIAGFGSRIFRNNVGLAWSGKKKFQASAITMFKLLPGDVVLSYARPIKFGLCEGSSDKIGWTQVVITEEMVGKNIAVFTAIEEKKQTGKATEIQKNFLSTVSKLGGIAILVRSLDDLKNGLDAYRPS